MKKYITPATEEVCLDMDKRIFFGGNDSEGDEDVELSKGRSGRASEEEDPRASEEWTSSIW